MGIRAGNRLNIEIIASADRNVALFALRDIPKIVGI